MIYFYAVLDQLATFDEYTRHEATAISRVTSNPAGNGIKKWNGPFVTT